MRSAPRREAPRSADPRGSSRAGRREPEHAILRLQRSAGNAAVTKLLRAGGDGTATETTPPKPSTAAFLNSFTPLYRGLSAKLEGGEPLDRIDIDTLRELRAEARDRGLRNLVDDCTDLLDRAAERGVVHAPEEAAPPEPEPEPIDVGALAVLVSSALVASIKEHVRRAPTRNESVRGGRWVGTVGGVEFALYEIDDLLLTLQDAQRIEALIRKAVEVDRPGGKIDDDTLWKTVVQLCKEGIPVKEIIPVLEDYTVPPTLGDWGSHWLREATAALPKPEPKPPKEEREEETEPIERPAKGEKLSPIEVAMRKDLAMRFGLLSGVGSGAMPTLTWVETELKALEARRQAHLKHDQAHLATNELRELHNAIKLVGGLGASIRSLMEKGDFPNLLAFDTQPMEDALAKAKQAEADVDTALKDLETIAAETATASGSLKSFVKKPPPTTTTAAKREGGTDGIWDPPIDAVKLAAWIDAHSPRTMGAKNVTLCADHIVVHKGTGGGTGTTHNSLTVFHISHGMAGSDDGCTVFFTRDATGVITIVAIGSHDNRYTTAYRIDWQQAGWVGGTWNIKTLILKR